MKSGLDRRRPIAPPSGIGVDARSSGVEPHALNVCGDVEGEFFGMIGDDVAWEYRVVDPRRDAVEVDERPMLLHRGAHRDIGPRLTAFALVTVDEIVSIRCDLVVVRRFLPGLRRCRRDRESGARCRELFRTPNAASAAPELDRMSCELKTRVEVFVGHEATSRPLDFLETGERGQP